MSVRTVSKWSVATARKASRVYWIVARRRPRCPCAPARCASLLISPAGFEAYFRELAPLLAAQKRDEAALADVVARCELEIDFDTIPLLAERHCLWLG